MSKQLVGSVGLATSLLVTQLASAQSADGSVALGASTAEAPSASASASATAEAEAPYEPYEAGYPPDNNLLELGIFGGVLFPSKDHNLRDERLPQTKYKIGPELGARLGYYPLSFLGLEGEAMGALSQIEGEEDEAGAGLYAVRGQVVLQAPLPYVVPFAAGGVGRFGAVSQRMGKDSDVAWHFGVGAKFALTNMLSLRLDGRDNLTAKTGGDGQAHTFEALLGLSAVIERARREPPPPPADTDHDGVLDRDDKCPTEMGVMPGGCPADSDGDGVLDRDDYCPKEAGPAPKGCKIIDPDPDQDGVPLPCDACPDEVGVKPDGCPVRDKDGDGIFDDKDKCINEPETKNGFEDSDGCPDTLPDRVKKFTGVVQGIFFDQGKATIRAQSTPTLAGAVKVLQEFTSIRLEISGHTSSEGDAGFNQKLSQDRADAVKAWLVEKGVSPERIQTRGVGPDEPIGDNKTPAGRVKNRRIEFKVLQ
jgi:outer membrane protein OmpA-like peptidoglycan-associated protein